MTALTPDPSPNTGRGEPGPNRMPVLPLSQYWERGPGSERQRREGHLFHNRVRRTPSIPRRLLRTGRFHLLPLYYLLRLSDAAREAMDRSGSYRFADHIYEGRPSGVGPLGRALDRLLLALPSARSFRNRERLSVRVALRETQRRLQRQGQVDVLSVPSGMARDLVQLSRLLGDDAARVRCHALDLDPEALRLAGELAAGAGVPPPRNHQGDIFDPDVYPAVEIALCSGITEFLPDADVVRLFRVIAGALRPGGALITTATARHPLSAYLLEQLADLRTHYRTTAGLRSLLRQAGYTIEEIGRDPAGYQTIALARPESP